MAKYQTDACIKELCIINKGRKRKGQSRDVHLIYEQWDKSPDSDCSVGNMPTKVVSLTESLNKSVN